jgi:DNA gyrase/topoisomerase IV subunit A
VLTLALPRIAGYESSVMSHTDGMAAVDEVPPEIQAERRRLRLHILEGIISSVQRQEEIGRMVWSCGSSSEALSGLTAQPFGFSEAQANHILDRPLRWQTKEQLASLVAERDSLLGQLA